MRDPFSLCYSDDNKKNTFTNSGNNKTWPNGSFTLADPDSDPYSDSDSCTIQILKERDPDPDLNQCEKF